MLNQIINKKCFLIYILLSATFSAIAQPKDRDVSAYSIADKGENIDFIAVNKNQLIEKPTIIFCQGSLPIPLIIRTKEGNELLPALANFDYKKMADDYNLVVISPPHIPVIVNESHLNNQSAYVTNDNDNYSYPQDYLDANYLEKYVERAHVVIAYLLGQKWVNTNRLLIAGHSQGAKVAAKIAFENNHISALGFLAGNPLGRVDEFIRRSRLKAQKGIQSHVQAQKEIDDTYIWWQWQFDNIDKPSQRGEDSPRTTISFSQPIVEELTSLKIPLYVAYGTEDVGASFCDLLTPHFIRDYKKDYKIVAYEGLEHNFMEVDSSENRLVEKCHWNKVMTDFTTWIESLK